MIKRRITQLVCALMMLVIPGAAHPAPQSATTGWSPRDGERLEFDVYRNGERFGSHTVAFQRKGAELLVDTDVELKVTFGPLTLFHYVHDVSERWTNDALTGVSARTKSDGKWKTLTAAATTSGLQISGAAFDGLVTSAAIPSTHWNIDEMRQDAMLSTETGEMLAMQVVDQGVERVETSGGEIDARRFLVKSDLDATFWYDMTGRWVKCAFRVQGSDVEYVLREAPRQAARRPG